MPRATAFNQLGVDLVAVDAEQDQLRLRRARLAQQVEPRAVAIIDLRAELARDSIISTSVSISVTVIPAASSICPTVCPNRP